MLHVIAILLVPLEVGVKSGSSDFIVVHLTVNVVLRYEKVPLIVTKVLLIGLDNAHVDSVKLDAFFKLSQVNDVFFSEKD